MTIIWEYEMLEMAYTTILQIYSVRYNQSLYTYFNLWEFVRGCSGNLLFCSTTLGTLRSFRKSDHSVTLLTTRICPSCPFLIPSSFFLREVISYLNVCSPCTAASALSKASDESLLPCSKSPCCARLGRHLPEPSQAVTETVTAFQLKTQWDLFLPFLEVEFKAKYQVYNNQELGVRSSL